MEKNCARKNVLETVHVRKIVSVKKNCSLDGPLSDGTELPEANCPEKTCLCLVIEIHHWKRYYLLQEMYYTSNNLYFKINFSQAMVGHVEGAFYNGILFFTVL